LGRLAKSYEKKLKRAGFVEGKILDAGCAFGGLSIHICETFPNIEAVGVDFSQKQVDFASKQAKSTSVSDRLTFIKADVQQLPFEDNSFDAVFNLNVAHIIENPIKMFNEFERVLKPGGKVFIKDLRSSFLRVFESEISYSFTANEASKLISQSNLRQGKFSTSILWWNYEVN
jgi:ubiquinone/menaquinone biosynthesis C-methylase UbiE